LKSENQSLHEQLDSQGQSRDEEINNLQTQKDEAYFHVATMKRDLNNMETKYQAREHEYTS